jgi:hypothetical protein
MEEKRNGRESQWPRCCVFGRLNYGFLNCPLYGTKIVTYRTNRRGWFNRRKLRANSYSHAIIYRWKQKLTTFCVLQHWSTARLSSSLHLRNYQSLHCDVICNIRQHGTSWQPVSRRRGEKLSQSPLTDLSPNLPRCIFVKFCFHR